MTLIKSIIYKTVTASWKEPYPGWVEGMNGPTGLIIGAARGKISFICCCCCSIIITVIITVNKIGKKRE